MPHITSNNKTVQPYFRCLIDRYELDGGIQRIGKAILKQLTQRWILKKIVIH